MGNELKERVSVQVLKQSGAMETTVLAKAVNRDSRGMVSSMRALERQGAVIKNGEGKGGIWSLTESSGKIAASSEPAAQ